MNAPSLPWAWSSWMVDGNLPEYDPSAGETPRKATLFGLWVFVVGIAVLGSATKAARLSVGDLLVHPFLFPVAIIAPILLLTQIQRFPVKVLAGLLFFMGSFVASTVSVSEPPVELGEMVRLLASTISIMVIALAIRSERDFVLGALGLILATGIMAFMSLQEDRDSVGAVRNALDTGNKNAYSLYALPAILIAGYVIVHLSRTSWLLKIPMIVAVLFSLVAIFTSANRSGYVGAVLIAGMLFWRKRGIGLIIVVGMAVGLVYVLQNYTGTAVLDRRLEETREGLKSDDLRKDLFRSAVELGITNPFLGVSPQKLPWDLGLMTMSVHGYRVIDPHNVFGFIFGGCGLICFFAFIYCGYSLWRIKPPHQDPVDFSPDFRSARNLMRMVLFLYIVRGMFTREILFNPGFVIAVGLAIGWCIVTKEASAKWVKMPEWDMG